MVESVPTLTELEFEAHKAFIVGWLAESYPDIDMSVGSVFYDRLLMPAVAFRALESSINDDTRNTQSLLQISADPNLASNEIVDNILSNFNVTRAEGTATTGTVSIILDRDVTTIIPETATLAYNGLAFFPNGNFVAVSSTSLLDNDNDRLITQRPDGSYFITIPVVASESRDGDSLKKGTQLTHDTLTDNVIEVEAYDDFKSGVLTEDNEALIDRLEDGITAKIFSGRSHIIALINDSLERKVPITVVGLGDLEMTRDSQNLFGISNGGKSDIYVKTNKTIISEAVELTATVTDAGTKTLTITVPFGTKPGYYFVANAYRLDNPNTLFVPTNVVLTEATSDDYDFLPAMREQDYRFSVFKETTFDFVDPDLDGGAINGDEISYGVTLPVLPDLATLQQLASSDDSRNPTADYLVKPAIPYIVELNLTITHKDNAPDVAAIKDRIIENVDKLSLNSSTLAASLIVDSCHDFLDNIDYVVTPIDIAATAYLPDGSTETLRSGTKLVIEDNSLLGVSGRTACFFVAKPAITINLIQDSLI